MQDEASQYDTIYDNTWQDKTKHGSTVWNKEVQGNARQYKTTPHNIIQYDTS